LTFIGFRESKLSCWKKKIKSKLKLLFHESDCITSYFFFKMRNITNYQYIQIFHFTQFKPKNISHLRFKIENRLYFKNHRSNIFPSTQLFGCCSHFGITCLKVVRSHILSTRRIYFIASICKWPIRYLGCKEGENSWMKWELIISLLIPWKVDLSAWRYTHMSGDYHRPCRVETGLEIVLNWW
jgi:hypothetical protein